MPVTPVDSASKTVIATEFCGPDTNILSWYTAVPSTVFQLLWHELTQSGLQKLQNSSVIPENRLKSNKASGTLLFVSGIWGAESFFGVSRGVDFSRQSIFQSIIDYVVLLRGRAQKIDQVPLQVQVNHHEHPNQHHAPNQFNALKIDWFMVQIIISAQTIAISRLHRKHH